VAEVADLYSALMQRGWAPHQAAALVGNMQQESNFNPGAINQGEGAHGLLQWRLDRWQNLQNFAASRGTSPFDRDTQLDYIGHEMKGPEARNASGFMAATDIPGANAALRRYIRYGDNSEGARLSFAQKAAGQPYTPVMSGSPQPQATDVASAFSVNSMPTETVMPLTFGGNSQNLAAPLTDGGQESAPDPAFEPRMAHRRKLQRPV